MLTRMHGAGDNWVDTPGPSSLLPVCVVIMVTAGNNPPPPIIGSLLSVAPSCSDRVPLWPGRPARVGGNRSVDGEIKTRRPGEQLAERENHWNPGLSGNEAGSGVLKLRPGKRSWKRRRVTRTCGWRARAATIGPGGSACFGALGVLMC